MESHPSNISTHYDKHRPRRNDDMLPIRGFHNFCKALLIRTACSTASHYGFPCKRYLDLCCGSGGDIGKLHHTPIVEYFGIDISEMAVGRARERLVSQRSIKGDTLCLNAFTVTCGTMLERMRDFDVVSCMFALHYAFATEATARIAVQNVSLALRVGGVFIGTVVDCDYLNANRSQLGKRFGDRFHKVHFLSSEQSEFGDAYDFSFTGAVEQLTEYVIRRDTLEALCSECGMKLLRWRKFFHYEQEEDAQLWAATGAQHHRVSDMYTSFMFVKMPSEHV